MPRTRTIRNPDCRVSGVWKRTDSLPSRSKLQGCNFRKRNILESIFRVEAAEHQLDIGRHFSRCSEARMTLSNDERPAVSRGKQECLKAWALHQEGAGAAGIFPGGYEELQGNDRASVENPYFSV